MEAPGSGHPDESQRGAPEHIIELLLGVMRPYPGQPSPSAGSVAFARAARAEAKVYADRIWEEAWNAGAVWGVSRNTQPIRFAFSPPDTEQVNRLSHLGQQHDQQIGDIR